ncbi:YfiR family protein [Flocculibacter collagenilyticus]|uniref:YfiR family protein n=1 Tax=Flocculibacter collagenilyticus TaxID=2744479 RepID=UPI0018F27A97|nr:YfiR family protein [Flocculibacter collagenilyticus]
MNRNIAFQHRTIACLCVLLLLLINNAAANAQAVSVEAVRAAFIFKMTRFVQWQGVSQNELIFCFSDTSPESPSSVLQQKDTLKTDKYNITIRKLALPLDDESNKSCQLVYISKHDIEYITEASLKLLSKTQLTVGDSQEFLANGGLISLVYEQQKIKFYVNRKELKQSSLRINAKLLALAKFYPQK